MDTDVVVVGAGIIGCAVARELAARRVGVQLLDARDIGRGATQASAGVLAPYIEGHEGGTLLDLTIRSLELYDSWIDEVRAESGVDVEYRRSGSLEVALDDRSAQRLRQLSVRFGGRAELRWLDGVNARAAEPALSASAVGALSAPTHGYVAAIALTEALARAALSHGASLDSGVRVVRIESGNDAIRVHADDGRWWQAGRVVMAAGSWTSQVRGLDDVAAREVRPVRGQLLRVLWRARPLERVIWGPTCYLVPWRDGTVLIGATVEDVGFDERNTVDGVRMLLEAASTLVPDMKSATFIDARAGLRPATSDDLPVIGPSESSDRVIYATGHYRNGVLLAPLTAKLVAGVLLDGIMDPALDALAPGRRATGARSAP